MASVVRAAFELGGAEVLTNEGYPGWKLNPNSEIVKIAKESYVELFGKEPKILAIHAGLECGLFSEKYPKLDMVSFGPTLRGVHSRREVAHPHSSNGVGSLARHPEARINLIILNER